MGHAPPDTPVFSLSLRAVSLVNIVVIMANVGHSQIAQQLNLLRCGNVTAL